MYRPGAGRDVPENIKLCSRCGRPYGDASLVERLYTSAVKRRKRKAAIAIVVIAVAVVIAVIPLLSIGLSSYTGSSATVGVAIDSLTPLVTVFYDVYFGGSYVKSGWVEPFSSDTFEHTYRWSSTDPTTLVISLEASGGFSAFLGPNERTITVSDGGHYTVNFIV